MTSKTLTHNDYTVGWICALDVELAAAQAMLDEEHDDLASADKDSNTYTFGSIGPHNVVLACLPSGTTGTNIAAIVAMNLLRSFPKIRFGLMVGIGGGAPGRPDTEPKTDLHLGDVVVSNPEGEYGGVIQYDFGKTVREGRFIHTGSLNKPPTAIGTAVTKLRAKARRKGYSIQNYLDSMLEAYPKMKPEFEPPEKDQLFRNGYDHKDGEEDCRLCTAENLVPRKPRTQHDPVVHYGLVGSANQVMRDAITRERLRQEKGILCFEMEAAGFMNDFPCLVIRGICDYCDTHKNKQWQPYAAATAAAYSKELLEIIPTDQINKSPAAYELMNAVKEQTELIRDARDTAQKIEEKIDLAKLPCAEGAAFDSYSDQLDARCHPATRVELRRQIRDWAEHSHGKPMFWLNGMAGTGKSTISRTIAQDFANKGQLGASFFFKRGEGDRSNSSKFFTTITTQLVQGFPSLVLGVKSAIEAQPAIASKTMEEQFKNLILQPFSELRGSLHSRKIIVVDALDECENEGHIKMIIRLLAQVQSVRPISIRIFLTSRPDLPIRLGFKEVSGGVYQDLVLHDIVPPIIEHDIATFLKDELARIRKQKEHWLSPDWPGEQTIYVLVAMAMPLFIFAATICRFIGDPRWNPEDRLATILEYQTASQADRFDRTYLPVLDQLLIGLSDLEKEKLATEFREIIGSIVVLAEPASTRSIANLLDIPRELVDRRLDALHSVLNVPASHDSPVRLLYLSFREFLLDPQKRGKSPFWINKKETHRFLGIKCLDLLSRTKCLKEDICSLQKPGTLRKEIENYLIEKCLPTEVQYACRYWVHHLEQGEYYISDGVQIHGFLKQRLLYWLEALSLVGRISESISTIATLQTLIKPDNSPALKDFLNDAKRFVLTYSSILDTAPLQLYSSAIIFAPETSIIKNRFREHIPSWIRRPPEIQQSWSTTLQTLEGHSGLVDSVAFSPDGRQLASGSEDRTIKLWDAVSGALQQTLEVHSDLAPSVVFSPDSEQLASGYGNGTVKIWDIASGAPQKTFAGHSEWVRSVAFSPDGKQLASSSADGTIKLWNTASGALHQTLEVHLYIVPSLAFSPDGKQLVSGSDDGTVKLWDVASGALQQTFEGQSDSVSSVNSVAFSSDGKQMASGSNNGIVKLWNIASGASQKTLGTHLNVGLLVFSSVRSVAFSPDGKQLASGSDDRTIKLWDIASGALQQTLEGHSEWVRSVAFSPDGKQLASSSGDQTVKLWDIASSAPKQILEGHSDSVQSIASSWVRSLAFSPDGKQLASGSDDRTVKLWDVASGALKQIFKGHSDWVSSVVFSPDGKQLASGSSDRTIKLWDIASGALKQTLRTHFNLVGSLVFYSIRSVAFSPDSQQLASGSFDGSIRLWDTASSAPQQTLESHSNPVLSVAFSSDGKQLASGCGDRIIKLWDAVSGAPQQTLKGHSDWVSSVAFSPDGKQLASGSNDRAIKLWDTASGTLQQTLHVGVGVHKLSFHADGSCLITDRGLVEIQPSQKYVSPPRSQRGDFVFAKESWITYDGKNLLWLPPEYRARVSDWHSKVLAFGHPSGLITFFEFQLPQLELI